MMQNENPKIFSYGSFFFFEILKNKNLNFVWCSVLCSWSPGCPARLDVELRRRKNSVIFGILALARKMGLLSTVAEQH